MPARFEAGRIVATPGAIEAMRQAGANPAQYLFRHLGGDWGELSEEDREENEYSINRHLRILSAYALPDGAKIWVITEADRSATTFLLPGDY